jgi:glutamine amidotransferase-like uncharacterized protein
MRSAAIALVTLAFFAASSALALDVAIYQGPGVGGKGPKNMEKLLTEREHHVEFVSPDDVRAGKLKEFDVVIFPGGSGSKEAAGLGDDGREEVRKFIRTGGGYVGVCAGAYLGTCRYDWGLKVIDAQTVDSAHWKRGEGMVEIELTDAGRKVLGDRQGKFEIRYANGPLLGPFKDEKLPDYEVLAHFRTELAKNGAPKGVMVDTPAIISSPLDEGRVVLISPHAEGMPELEWIIENAVRWSARQSAAPVEEPALAR